MPPTALTLTPPDAEWMQQARCAGYWDLMAGETPQHERHAKEICHACPVKELCARWTLSLPPREDVYGVAAGMTASEREVVRRRIRRGMARSEQPRVCTRGKDCVHGEVMQPASAFYLRPKHPSGRESQCRSCCQKRCRERKAAKNAAEAMAS